MRAAVAHGRGPIDGRIVVRHVDLVSGASEEAFERAGHAALWRLARLALAVAIVLTPGIVYVLTTARDIVVGDSPEFVGAAVTFGVAHPPGYPLLTLLGHLFSLLPVGPLPFRVNLVSAACHAAAVGLVYLTALRLSRSHAASAVAAIALAFNALFWSWSLVAETFPLNDLLVAAMLYFLVLWHEKPERAAPLILAAFMGGLGVSNHLTIVLLVPAIVVVLWGQRAVLFARPQIVAACVGASLLGLLPYAYLPWAAAHHPAINWGSIASFSDLVGHFLRRDYGTGQLVSAVEYQGGSPVQRIATLLDTFGLVSGLLLALGAVGAYRRLRWYFWFVACAFVFAGPAFVWYSNVNLASPLIGFVLERFYLVSHVVAAPLMAFGVLLAAEQLSRIARLRGGLAELAVTAALILATFGPAVGNYAAVDQSQNHVARWFAEDVLASLGPNTILLAGGDETVMPVSYLQAVERQRPDVTLVMLGLLPADWYVRQLREHHPDLVVPFTHFDGRTGTIKALVDANPDRPAAVIWAAPDNSLKTSYWYYSRGVVLQLLPMTTDVSLETMTSDNERLLAGYRIPRLDQIKPRTFERAILVQYAMAPYRVGEDYEIAHLPEGARMWYERALSIDPDLPKASWRLGQLPPP